MQKILYSKSEALEQLNISRKTFESWYPLFKAGTHYIHKNPINKKSPRLWDLEKVRKTLMQPTNTLTRLLK
jgi:gentisate 1,2-dioxygenase